MAYLGCDLSVYQGNVDLEKAKANGIDFVILKSGYGKESSQVADNFEINYKKAKAAGLPVGCYHYSYATNVNEARQEAEACLSIIRNKTFDYPVFLDLEESKQFDTGKYNVSEMIKAFCSILENAGYFVGLYMSKSQLMSYVSEDVRSRYAIWVAQYNSSCTYTGQYGMWQYSSTGSVPGIPAAVDMNYCYIDYPSIIKSLGKNGFSKDISEAVKPVDVIVETPKATSSKWTDKMDSEILKLQEVLNNKGANLSMDGIAGDKTLNAAKKYTIELGDRGELTAWVQTRLNSMGFSCGSVDGICGNKTMNAINAFQKSVNVGIGYLGGEDWYYLIR